MNTINKTTEKQDVMKQDQIEKHATTPKRNLVVYVSLTYLVFLCLLALTGVLISLNAPSYVQTIAKNVCAWAPTIVVLIMFRRLFPGVSFGEFFRRNFIGRVNPLIFLLLLVLQVAIVALAVGRSTMGYREGVELRVAAESVGIVDYLCCHGNRWVDGRGTRVERLFAKGTS